MSSEVEVQTTPLAAEFDAVSTDQWRAKVGDPAAAGVPSTTLEDAIEVPWLYTPEDALASDPAGLAAQAPFVRGNGPRESWDIRQERTAAAPTEMAKQLLEDLEGGSTSASIVFDAATRGRVFADSPEFEALCAEGGLVAATIDELDAALAGVKLDLAPIALRAGASAIEVAAQFVALLERRGHDPSSAFGSLGVDPIGALAQSGAAESELAAAVRAAGEFAAQADALLGGEVTLLRADASVFGEAGASPALELALAIAIATEYLRACEAAGLDATRAASRIELVLSVGADQFLEIARLRAARRLWARVLELAGVPEAARRSKLVVRTNARVFTAVDPWVNMLRATTATFAGAVGGADSISVASFDLQRGNDSELGRRIARNTQLVLLDESSLARVGDPGGGSWFVEDLTDKIAKAAWRELSEIESAGGAAAAITGSSLREKIVGEANRRREQVNTRQSELTGLNTFPLLGGDGFEESAPADHAALIAAQKGAAAGPIEPAADFAALVERAAAGASVAQLAAARGLGTRVTGEAFAIARESEVIEALRSAAAAADEAPQIFLACLGPNAEHNVSATWAANFFGSGGIAALASEPLIDPAEAGEAFVASGAKIAAVCAGKKAEGEQLAAAVAALKTAGAARVYLAPASADAATAAGADVGVADGVDMEIVLSEALELCGVTIGASK